MRQLLVLCMTALFLLGNGGLPEKTPAQNVILCEAEDLKSFQDGWPVDFTDSGEVYQKVVLPYGITGMMFYDSWTDPAELDVEKLMQFYEFNVFFHSEAEKTEQPRVIAVPARIVEKFLGDTFGATPEQLHQAECYDPDTGWYLFPHSAGIGYTLEDEILSIEDCGDNHYCITIESWIGGLRETGRRIVLTVENCPGHIRYCSSQVWELLPVKNSDR